MCQVKGKFAEMFSFLIGSGNLTQTVRLGGKYLYSVNHLVLWLSYTSPV